MFCKLTKEEGKAVKAHIIPTSFYGNICPISPSLVMNSDEERYPKRSRTGIYDDDLVSFRGEQFFQIPDNYAFKTLIKTEMII